MSLKAFFKQKASPLILSVLFGLSSLACAGVQRVTPQSYEKSDPICGTDDRCRRLTVGEVGVLRTVFGDDIQYDNVRIYHRPYNEILGVFGKAITPDGNIYLPDTYSLYGTRDFSKIRALWPFLAHEAAHILQQQDGTNMHLTAVWLLLKHKFNYTAAYQYNLDDVTDFADLNIEQQGQFIGDYMRSRNLSWFLKSMKPGANKLSLRNSYTERFEQECKTIARYEALLRPHMPVEPDRSCNGQEEFIPPTKPDPSIGITFDD